MEKQKKLATFKVISPNLKRLGIPVLSLIGIVFCFLFAGKIGFNKITVQRKQIKDIGKTISILQKKKETLSVVSQTLSDNIQFFSLALPDTNPALSVIYQIKNQSSFSSLYVENIKGGSESKGKTYSRVDLNFDLNGSLENIISFLKVIENFAPIVSCEKLELNQSSGMYRASVTLRSYWASYPTEIPAITQPLSDFTEEELNMITKISELTLPPFSTIYPSVPSERINPFE